MRDIKVRCWQGDRFYYFNSLDEIYSEGASGGKVDFSNSQQYTGLKGKNGVEIYEGDFVKCAGRPRPILVTFVDGCFYTKDSGGPYRLGGWNTEAIEVIGNTHQNPELLEEG